MLVLYSKEELEILNLKNYDMYPNLELSGLNDKHGFQIFTPRFIVDEMIKNIGIDYVCDLTNRILEPSSGDGAFTVRILELRLMRILETNANNFLQESLIALSTIYSIELDQELLIKQRNNMFTMLNYISKKNNVELTKEYLELAELIIKTNIVWGETNVTQEGYYNKSNFLVGWYMPTEIKTIIQTPKLEKIETTNLFGEIDYIEIPSGELTNTTRYKYRRTKSNQIKFAIWHIKDDLTYTKVIEPVKRGD